MRNVMREIDVPDWQERLAAYLPQEDSERRDLQEVLQAVLEARGYASLCVRTAAVCCIGSAKTGTSPVPVS